MPWSYIYSVSKWGAVWSKACVARALKLELIRKLFWEVRSACHSTVYPFSLLLIARPKPCPGFFVWNLSSFQIKRCVSKLICWQYTILFGVEFGLGPEDDTLKSILSKEELGTWPDLHWVGMASKCSQCIGAGWACSHMWLMGVYTQSICTYVQCTTSVFSSLKILLFGY